MPDDPKLTSSDLTALPDVNSSASFIAELQENGYCVVPSVIPKDRVEGYIDDALSWLEVFELGFNRDDKSTWT